MLTSRIRSFIPAALIVSAAASLFAAGHVKAQTDVRPGDDNSRIAVVRSSDVYVRCGAAESYYPFARLNAGDLVKVTGEKFEWSRVMTTGPAFTHTFGYIKYAKNDSARFRISADGKTGQTLGKVDIIAPNLDTKNNPKDSWKSLVRLEADQTLRVIETIQSEKDIIVKVALPEYAQGWVSTAYLDPATPEQVKQWHDQKNAATIASTTKTTQTPTSTSTAPAKATASNDTGSVRQTPPTSTTSTTNPNTTNTTTAPIQTNKPVEVVKNTITPEINSNTQTSSPPTATTPATTPLGDGFDTATSETDAQIAGSESTTGETSATGNETPAKPVNEKKLPTWEDLETVLKQLQKEPVETAEVGPLRELYLDLAKRSVNDARIARYASGRAEQLKLWTETQQKRNELEALRARTRMSAEEAIAVEKALLSSAEYTAVGRVAASTIYDGQSLPKLLRLQEAATGRTVAYLQPDEEYEIVKLIGSLVGIVGEKTYDGTIRLNIITPKRIDVLTPEQTATVPTDIVSPN